MSTRNTISIHRPVAFAIGLIASTTIIASALADQITLIHSGTASGTLNGIAFESTAFTITGIADTDDRVVTTGGGWAIEHQTSQIEIEGVGTFDFISKIRTWKSGQFASVGLGRSVNGGVSGLDLLLGPSSNDELADWEMLTSIGPVTSLGHAGQWNVDPFIITTGGIVILDSGPMDLTFTAIVVPAPGTALIGLAMLIARPGRRRRDRACG